MRHDNVNALECHNLEFAFITIRSDEKNMSYTCVVR